MSDRSEIEWCDATWNPVRGCTKISPGCKHCYAETFAERWRGVPGHPYEQGFDLRIVPEKLGEPLRWRAPRRVFVNSMSDLFHEGVDGSFIAAVYGVMASCPQHTFMVLTKRATYRRAWFTSQIALSPNWPAQAVWEAASEVYSNGPVYDLVNERWDLSRPWPLPNVWEGVSVEDRRYGLPRIDELRSTPAAVRFLSIEPLLEDLGDLDLTGIDWVIVGAESGRGARACDPDWVRRIRDQAHEQGVALFIKQLPDPARRGRVISLPVLDGQRHDAMPTARSVQ